MNGKKVSGVIFSVLGLLGTVLGIIKIVQDQNDWFHSYSYTAPFTSHEIAVILVVAISVIVLIVGLCQLLAGKKE